MECMVVFKTHHAERYNNNRVSEGVQELKEQRLTPPQPQVRPDLVSSTAGKICLRPHQPEETKKASPEFVVESVAALPAAPAPLTAAYSPAIVVFVCAAKLRQLLHPEFNGVHKGSNNWDTVFQKVNETLQYCVQSQELCLHCLTGLIQQILSYPVMLCYV